MKMGRKEILKQIFFILFLCIFGRCLQAVIITWGPASGTIVSAGCAVRQWPPPCALAGVGGGGPSTVIRLLFTVCLCPLSKHIKKSVKQLNHTV